MCGRYASARKRIELLEEFRIERDRVAEPLEADYNVAPTKPVYAVLTRDARPAEAASQAQGAADAASSSAAIQPGVARELRVVRWGLVPFWAKDPKIGSRLINARAETVDSKPAFRQAFKRRRCLLPADGYYEWQRPDGTGGSSDQPGGKGGGGDRAGGRDRAGGGDRAGGAKQPYFITRGDGGPLAFAGLYELWRDAALPDDHQRAWLWTATIITTSAPDDLGKIHDRMPMVIAPDRWPDWLDPACDDPADLMALLAPAASGGLISYPVSTAVNSVRNNGPQLIKRIEPDPAGWDQGRGAPTAGSRRSRSAASQRVSGSAPDKLL
jgi:putative SOS response-associated peptidase YedK